MNTFTDSRVVNRPTSAAIAAAAAALLCMTLATASHGQTFLGPTPYLSLADSPFDTAHPTFVLETFEDGLFNVAGVSSNAGLSVVFPGPITDSVDADDGVIDGNGNGGHTYFGGGLPGIAKIKISNTSGGIEVDHLQFSFGEGCAASPDVNGDGKVDGGDLGLLLGMWGACPAGCCAADLNGDGIVDGADLGAMLGAWM